MMRRLLLLAGLLWALAARGQTYFNERYSNQNLPNAATAVALTDSGNYVIAAQGGQPGTVSNGALLLRFLDAAGQHLRTQYFSQRGYYYFPSFSGGLIAVRGGGYALGASSNDSTGQSRAQLWRFDEQGDTLWVHSYELLNRTLIAYSCRQLANGDFVLTGIQTTRGLTGQTDALLLRTDSLGHERWRRTYDVGAYDYSYSIELTLDGGFVLGGYSYPTQPLTQNDALIIKTDSAGNEQWHQLLGTQFDGESCAVLPTRDGGYIVASDQGTFQVSTYILRQPVLYKLDASGQVVWQRSYGPSRENTGLYRVYELADGSFIAAGQQRDSAGAAIEGIVLKVCADGDSLWYRSYKKLTGTHSDNYSWDIAPTSDGGFVGAGFLFARPPDTGTNDAWVFKTDSAGYLQAGGAPVTVQCRPLELVEPEIQETVSIWPNPAPDGRFALRLAQVPATLTVTDALGRAVLTASCEPRTANWSRELDLSRQPAGVYALRVTWPDGRAVTRRLVR